MLSHEHFPSRGRRGHLVRRHALSLPAEFLGEIYKIRPQNYEKPYSNDLIMGKVRDIMKFQLPVYT